MKPMFGLLASLALSLLLVACGGDSGSKSTAPKAVISLLTPSQAVMLKDNQAGLSLQDAIPVQLTAADSIKAESYAWQLLQFPEGSLAQLDESNTQTVEFIADTEGDYVVGLTINSGSDNPASGRFIFTATSPRPVAITDREINVATGSGTVGLDGSKSIMPLGVSGELTYHWRLTERPLLSSESRLLYENSSRPTLVLDAVGEYKVEFYVSYNDKQSDVSNILVSVFQGNVQPVAKADNIEAIMGEKIVLDAGGSSDAEGAPLEYRWRLVGGPLTPLPVLNNPTTARPDFTADIAGNYTLKLFVFDGQRASEEIDVQVSVKPDPLASTNLPPAGELIASGYYPSNSIGDQEVGLRADFKFVGYDPEGKELQFIRAELLEKPAGSKAELVDNKYLPLGHKIQKLDIEGIYRVSMTVSDGVNEITREATMNAKIGGVNNRPSSGYVEADSQAVLVGQPLLFTSASAKDTDGDPIIFEWSLIDKPTGSNAIIQPVTDPDEGDYRRAKVLTDLPGVYRAHLIVKDDRGLYSSYDSEAFGYAKISNQAPVISSVVWKRSWSAMQPGETYFQMLTCMSGLSHRAVVNDPDGDKVFSRYELVSTPEDGEYTSSPSASDCPDARGTVFTRPGTYVFRYSATDVINPAPDYDFIVEIESLENARGVRLRSLNDDNESLWRPMPYEYKPPYGFVFSPTSKPITSETSIRWSLTAADADYTVENVVVKHLNGGLASLTPRFEGLTEGRVIKQGETVEFRTIFPAVPCQRNDDKKEGFHLSFNIKDQPKLSFVYEHWVGDSGYMSTWEQCQPGQLD